MSQSPTAPVTTLSEGFAEAERPRVAALYWEAFARKLGRVLGPADLAQAFLANAMDPGFAIVARDADGRIMGLAGYKTADGALVSGGFVELSRAYGRLGAMWRGALLSLIARPVAPGVLLMDGICVAAEARGQGVGAALLDAIKRHAQAGGMTHVRLDVIDTNPRARALYERQGFVAQETAWIGPLRLIFGFRSATRMIWRA